MLTAGLLITLFKETNNKIERESKELTERWYRYIERIPVIDQIPLELFARTVLDAKMQREKEAKFNDGCESIVS